MAKITPGETFSDPSLTAAKLNALMDSAGLVTLGPSDLTSGAHFFLKARPGSPAEGDAVVTTAGALETYDGSAWSFDRTDPVEVPMTNTSGLGMTAGDAVYADPANDDSFIQADGLVQRMNVAGVLKANTADSAVGQVYVRGVVTALVGGAAGVGPGYWLWGTGDVGISQLNATDPATTPAVAPNGADFVGIALDTIPAGTVTLAQALLWR